MQRRVLLSWSGGKDSALALTRLQADPRYAVAGLITTVTTGYDRVSIHGVRRTLLHRQATALGLPLHEIEIEPQSSNAAYEAAWVAKLNELRGRMNDVALIAFGDIFLQDVRQYREDMVRTLGFAALFPLWGESTSVLAAEASAPQYECRVVCIDTEVLPSEMAGSRYDVDFLERLPAGIDPCGERGEFHTFVSRAPGFSAGIACEVGETVIRDGRFAYCDLLPAGDAG